MKKNSNLEEEIKKRIQEAEDKDIFGMASSIAEYLGDGGSFGTDRDGGFEYTYDKGVFMLNSNFRWANYGDGMLAGGSTIIQYKGEEVFCGLPITKYIPGPWESSLKRLYCKAKVAEKEKLEEFECEKKANQKTKENKLKDNWGI